MSILVLTYVTNDYLDIASISDPNKKTYSDRHGYCFESARNLPYPAVHPCYDRLLLIRDRLKYFDWIFWTDADSLIMNSAISLESIIDPEYDLIFSEDIWCPLNGGQFLVKNSAFSSNFLMEVYSDDRFVNHLWREQETIGVLLAEKEEYRNHIKILPHRTINSQGLLNCHPFSSLTLYQPGDFLVHFCNGNLLDREVLLNFMRAYLDRAC